MDKKNNFSALSAPHKYRELPGGFTPPVELSGLAADTPILVGFSGGADSGALLHLLCRYSKLSGAKIYAAHVNHGIRGEEADRDEEFCRRSAEALGVDLFVLRADVPTLARESGESIELSARRVRYEFFSELMKKHGIPLLATAHNANDNLETLLFNLARGSGLSGLCGIPPRRECDGGLLVRPILQMSREDVLAYCEGNGIEYVTDSTNADTDYTRNKIRARVIPVLKEISSRPERKAAQTSALLRSDSDFILSAADEFYRAHITPDGTLPTAAVSEAHKAIASRAIMRLYGESADKDAESLELVHIDDIIRLCERAVPHSALSLPSKMRAKIEDGQLKIMKQSGVSHGAPESFDVEAAEGNNFVSQINAEIIIGNTQRQINIYKKSIQMTIDSAKIKGMLSLRSRREGDRILMGGMHKSLKKLMCDKKIPLDERYRLPVICDGEEIAAVPFVGVSDTYRAKKDTDTQNTLSIQFYLY